MQDLNDLYYFAAVVDHGGFAAAERALGIPKSRLSRRISALESELGVRLLQRSTRRFAVTDVGTSVHRHAQSMLAEAQAVNAVRHRGIVDAGRLLRPQRQRHQQGQCEGECGTAHRANSGCRKRRSREPSSPRLRRSRAGSRRRARQRLSESRISRSSSTSSLGPAGAASTGLRMRLTALTTRKMAKATITNWMSALKNSP